MVIKVFKYPLNYKKIESLLGSGSQWEQRQIIELPAFSEVLRVDLQGDNLVLWAKVISDDLSRHKVGIEIVGTGHEILNPGSKYLNTFFDGGLVLHVFVDYGLHTK